MHETKGLTPAMKYLCKAAKRAMSGLERRCQQLRIHDPTLKCKLFDTLVKPILCYGCEICRALGCKPAIADLERVQIGFLKILLGVQTHTSSLIWLPVDSKSTHPRFEPLLVQDRIISILVIKSV